MTMTIKTAKWSRVLKMRLWTRGRDLALVRILEGDPREKGMMTLKRDKQLWNYLPQAGRVMKLPSGMLDRKMLHGWSPHAPQAQLSVSLRGDFPSSRARGGQPLHPILGAIEVAAIDFQLDVLQDRAAPD